MPTLSKQKIDKDGLNPTLANAANDDAFEVRGDEVIYVENTDASSHTVTIPAQKSSFEDGTHGKVDLTDIGPITIPSGEFRLIAGISPATYGKSNGEAEINYDATTGMKVAVLQQ